MRSPDAPDFYFTSDVDDASAKWRFYTTLERRTELLLRTHYVGPDDRPAAAPGSLLVTYDSRARITALVTDGWGIEVVVADVDKRPAAVILRKLR